MKKFEGGKLIEVWYHGVLDDEFTHNLEVHVKQKTYAQPELDGASRQERVNADAEPAPFNKNFDATRIKDSLETLEKLAESDNSQKRKPASSEMRGGPGFRVLEHFERSPVQIVQRLMQFETTDISDALNRMFTMDPLIRNVVGNRPLYGAAITVKVFPGDNLMVHKALDVAQPGDVIVIDTSGEPRNAVVGDMIANKARHRKIGGFIIDGLVRDLPGIVEADVPIYAKGVTAFGPLHRGPGEIGYSISCGGIVVNPGDIVCADPSGIVVVRQEFANDTLAYLEKQRPTLSAYVDNVKKGAFSNAWVDQQLQADGCLFE